MWHSAVATESELQGGRVHKFGGSSLADADCYRRVAEILHANTQAGDFAVVSAAGKTTNALVLICHAISEAPDQAERALGELVQFQSRLITELLLDEAQDAALAALHADIAELRELLQEADAQQRYNQTVGFGEVWSARLLAAFMTQQGMLAQWLDSRTVLVAEQGPQPEVLMAPSALKLAEQRQAIDAELVVMTGFLAQTETGASTTLGRNGSDYSATALAALLNAKSVSIWTDVAGIFSADPNKVAGARTLPTLSLSEASELARLGSPVLHTRTLQPLNGRKIRLTIRSTFSAHGSHTQVAPTRVGERGAKIVTSLERVCIISFTASSRQAFKETTEQVRDYLNRHHLAPLTKHYRPDQRLVRLCFTQEVANAAFEKLSDFQPQGGFSDLALSDNHNLLALVGDGVAENARHYHCFHRLLHEAPVEFIQPGEQGLSLVAVLRETPLQQLLVNLHHGISSPQRKLGVALFGTGNIGSGWLELFKEQQPYLADYHRMEVQLCALCAVEGALVDFTGIDVSGWQARFETEYVNMSFEELTDLLGGHPYDELVVIDATDSHLLAHRYPMMMERGFHLISANKYPASGPLSLYREITQQQQEKARIWLNNATVGAALPLHQLVADLRNSGDEVESICGVLSGTLSWIFARYNGHVPFSELIREAQEFGITEPDPREDLTGEDVRRKLLILAREVGIGELELDDIEFVSLLPEELLEGDVDQFFANTDELDEQMAAAFFKAQEDGRVLRYIARLDRSGEAHVGLEALDPDDPMAIVAAGENLYAISSRWYFDHPLIIRGPAAGPELTAGALQSDLFQLCGRIRAHG